MILLNGILSCCNTQPKLFIELVVHLLNSHRSNHGLVFSVALVMCSESYMGLIERKL